MPAFVDDVSDWRAEEWGNYVRQEHDRCCLLFGKAVLDDEHWGTEVRNIWEDNAVIHENDQTHQPDR